MRLLCAELILIPPAHRYWVVMTGTYSRNIGLAFGSKFIHCSIQFLTLIGHVTAPDTDLFRDVLVLSRFKSGFIVPIPTLSMIMS